MRRPQPSSGLERKGWMAFIKGWLQRGAERGRKARSWLLVLLGRVSVTSPDA